MLCRGHVINDLNGKEIVGIFFKKNSKKKIRKSLELKNLSKEKVINCTLNGNNTIIRLIAG